MGRLVGMVVGSLGYFIISCNITCGGGRAGGGVMTIPDASGGLMRDATSNKALMVI